MKRFIMKNKLVSVTMLVYFITFVLGLLTMIYPGLGFGKPTVYSSILFFVIAFFSFGGYFYVRENSSDYSLLYFSLISILSASYLFVFDYTTLSYILGTGFLIFSVLNAITRAFAITKLQKENNSLWILRTIFLILILFFSILTIQNFYREVSEVQTIMVGYYLLSYGLLSMLELFLLVKLTPEDFEHILNGDLDKLGKKQTKKMKSVKKFNENVDKLDEIVKKVDAPKRKRNKRKKSK